MVGAKELSPNRRFGIALGPGRYPPRYRHLPAPCTTTGSGLPAAALACGLQNAIGSSYCGLQIRTTHISGIVTDLGTMIGQWLRHRWWTDASSSSSSPSFLEFGLGGYVGAVAEKEVWSHLAHALPAVSVFLAACRLLSFVHFTSTEMLPDAPPKDFKAEPDDRAAIAPAPVPEPAPRPPHQA
jgi:hypothetical protein